ncbi:AraC family transcriptional regulator [Flammeovirga sp. EKP202]|uniref:helix-turn-helix domain-containing protein n=1 Tax=Flammeovirga sp. EKP202 TaxID=2770592 RepID=UPI00165FBA52|nr:AraC family transcriptional regulator [Flammeovirga sp. EKP202]MBD0405189.1 helix-turn-helix transcriptional regulator [Flammeovirga sp. EKP202]
MIIEFSIESIDGFLSSISQQMNVALDADGFDLPAHLGEGFFKQYALNNTIHIVYYNLFLKEEISIVRNKGNNLDLLPITFWLTNSGIQQQINEEQKMIGSSTQNGIFFPSNSIETQYSFPKKTLIENITIFIDKDWLRQNLNIKDDYINSVILKEPTFFLYEALSHPLSDTLEKIKSSLLEIEKETITKLSLLSSTLLLLEQFFSKLQNRGLIDKYHQLKTIDIDKIFSVKEIVTEHYQKIPLIKELAKEVGMNDRKLQNIFKQVFGISIYQFGLSIKMEKAKNLLLTSDYTIAEIGHYVGYSNLSHFTEQFKRFYGITPKSFQKTS